MGNGIQPTRSVVDGDVGFVQPVDRYAIDMVQPIVSSDDALAVRIGDDVEFCGRGGGQEEFLL